MQPSKTPTCNPPPCGPVWWVFFSCAFLRSGEISRGSFPTGHIPPCLYHSAGRARSWGPNSENVAFEARQKSIPFHIAKTRRVLLPKNASQKHVPKALRFDSLHPKRLHFYIAKTRRVLLPKNATQKHVPKTLPFLAPKKRLHFCHQKPCEKRRPKKPYPFWRNDAARRYSL